MNRPDNASNRYQPIISAVDTLGNTIVLSDSVLSDAVYSQAKPDEGDAKRC